MVADEWADLLRTNQCHAPVLDYHWRIDSLCGFWGKKIYWAKEGQSGTRGGLVTNECRLEVGQQQHGQFDTNSGSMVSSRDERIDLQNTESCPVFSECLCAPRLFLEGLWQQMKAL